MRSSRAYEEGLIRSSYSEKLLQKVRSCPHEEVYPSVSAEACTILQTLAGLGSTNKTAIFLPFPFQALALSFLHFSLRPFISHSLTRQAEGIFSFPFLSGYMGPRTLISSGNNTANELARRGALLHLSTVQCGLSPLPLASTLLWNRTRTVSSKFFRHTSPLSIY